MNATMRMMTSSGHPTLNIRHPFGLITLFIFELRDSGLHIARPCSRRVALRHKQSREVHDEESRCESGHLIPDS